MFCTNCGTNAGDVAFCPSCGNKLAAAAPAAQLTGEQISQPVEAAASEAPFLAPAPKKPVNKMLFIAIGGGVAALAIAVVAVFAFMPYSLSADRANELLVPKTAFSSDLKDADEPNHIGDVEYPVFGTGDECTQETSIASLFDEGTMLAFSDYSNDGTDFGVWEQSFWEFESADTPKAIIEATRSGYDNSDCEYFSSTSTSVMSSTVSELGDSRSSFGIASENSVFFVDKTSYISSFLTLNWKEGQMFVQKGRYLMSIRFTSDTDAEDIYGDFESAAKLALESFH